MDETYKISVLHIHNPHLIWIEVNHDKKNKCSLRQIGLFGVVPKNPEGKVSSRWDPQSSEIAKKFIKNVEKLSFKVKYCDDDNDNGSSIFDKQSHIFGEIFGYQNGHPYGMAMCLHDLGYAHCSKKEFIRMLAKGKIQTVFDGSSSTGVLMKIVQHYQEKGIWENKKEMFYSHLTPTQVKRLEKYQVETLTVENVERHLKITSNHISTDNDKSKDSGRHLGEAKPGQKIINDYNTDSIELSPVKFVEDTLKKLTIVNSLKVTSGTQKETQFAEKKHPPKVTSGPIKTQSAEKKTICYIEKDSDSRLSDSIAVYYDEINSNDENGDEENNGTERAIGRANSRMKIESEKMREIPDPYKEALKFEYLLALKKKAKISTKKETNSPKDLHELRGKDEVNCAPISREPETKTSSRRRMERRYRVKSLNEEDELRSNDASPNHNKTGKRLIAYGPPTNDLKSLVVKEAPTEPVAFTPPKPADNTVTPWNEDDIDSTIGIDITNYGKPNKNDQNNKSDSSSTDKNDLGLDLNLKIKNAQNATPPKSNKRDNVDINGSQNTEEKYTSLKDFIKSRAKHSISDKTNRDHERAPYFCENKDKNAKSKLFVKLQKIKTSSGSEEKSYDPMSSTDSSQRETEKDSATTDDDVLFIQKKNESNRHQNKQNDDTLSSIEVTNSTSSKVQDSDEEEFAEIQAKLAQKCKPIVIEKRTKIDVTDKAQINVNPFKNLDGSQSVFVENLVAPLLLAHTKNQNKILPRSNLRDVPFKSEIHCTLRNMQVKTPSRLQSVSWAYILRGHSVFMIGSVGSGKTLGYLPAVCNLVIDYNFEISGQGPICIIVCATAQSVADVARQCKMFLNHQRVVTCFPGVDNTRLVTDLLNGCEILVTTPSMLCRYLGVDIGVDLRRVVTVVFDDCERLSQVYEAEVKAIQYHVKQMLKTRTDRQLKVQYVLASRQWCDFMLPLAKKAPDTIVAFAAFHECVLYSKTNTSVSYVMKDKKIDAVVEFMKETDESKLTVIVCRSDDEVVLIENTLKRLSYSVVACNNEMTLHDLYKLRTEKLDNSVLICCDGNLNHLNVTSANYLIHYSMPALYSQFCSRFSVLNENYPSIFDPSHNDVKIKVLLEETNVEQLPKILNFVKRCTKVPATLDEVARKVLEQKDYAKAQRYVPVCDSLLGMGECVDILSANCQERHAILEGYDNPKPWVPRHGVITFKIIHYNSAVSYSARLLTHTIGDEKIKYPETYATLCMKLGLFYSKDENKRLHGEPKMGDICAVAVKQNFIARCQVLKILTYEKGKAKEVVIKLIDEEQLEIIRAVDLYYLPDEFRDVETHVVKIRLANIQPQDKDVTFSELAKNKLKRITDGDEQLYLKSKVSITIANSIFVDTLEACQDLSALCETVVKHDFKKMLLESHAIPNPDHIFKLQKLCDAGNLKVTYEPNVLKKRLTKKETEHRWAHLDKNDWSEVSFSNMINAGKFFVRLEKFDKCVNALVSDIKQYVADNPKPIQHITVKDIVLAEFPDDCVFERAVIEDIIDETKVMCFFVDNADWRVVPTEKLRPITKKIINQIPFQAIECRLVGVKPPVDSWTEFSSNWLHDNCSEDSYGEPKRMFVKYFTKEKAEVTGGHKYGVVLVDTTTEVDVVINKRMIELNLAAVREEENEYLQKPLDFTREKSTESSTDYEEEIEMKDDKRHGSKDLIPVPIKLIPKDHDNEKISSVINMPQKEYSDEEEEEDNQVARYVPNDIQSNEKEFHVPLNKMFAKPIRSFPLVNSKYENPDRWDICLGDTFNDIVEPLGFKCSQLTTVNKLPDDESMKDQAIVVPTHMESELLNSSETQTLTKTPANVTETVKNERDLQDSDNLMFNNKKSTNEECKNHKTFHKRQLNQKGITEILNTSDVSELNETEVLRDGIKDVSIFDSDDTLSLVSNDDFDSKVCEKIKMITNKVANENNTVLDSDDNLSTESNKIEKIEKLPLNLFKNERSFDSDDLETEDESITQKTLFIDTEEINNESQTAQITAEIKTTKTDFDKSEYCSNLIENKAKDTEFKGKTIKITESVQENRTPQLVWRQDKQTVTVKIKLIGVEDYSLTSGNRSLIFETYQNDCKYAFDIELYGIIESERTRHYNKGQYILVKLTKFMKKPTKWLKLTKDLKNWIFYDVDSLDASSDEDATRNDDALKVIMDHHEKALELDDDDDMPDDTALYRYRDD